MKDIRSFIEQSSEWPEVFFACLFSLGLALFYTVIFSFLYKKPKPIGLFFGVFPVLIVLAKLVVDINVFAVIIALFILIFPLFILGALLKTTRDAIGLVNKRLANEKATTVVFSILKGLLLVVIGFAGLTFFGPASIFIGVIIAVLFQAFLKYNKKNSFLNLQANLPTSKIRSMAMGQVEVVGNVLMQEPLVSRIGDKECIGYRYKVQNVRRDKDGKKTYSTISDEVVCNDFEIEDTTGRVKVNAKNIDFKWLAEDASYQSNNKKYTQYLLFDSDKVLLIANANSHQNGTFLEKGSDKSVFTLAPLDATNKWNRNKPLLDALIAYSAIFIVIVALILFSNIEITENTLQISFDVSWNDFKLKNPFNLL